MSRIDDSTLGDLQRTLGRLVQQAAVVAANVANVETPGYKALEMEYAPPSERFALELRRSSTDHFGLGAEAPAGRLRESRFGRLREDGNTVDIDVEMTRLAHVSGRYNAVTQMIRKRFALIRYAATDGRQ